MGNVVHRRLILYLLMGLTLGIIFFNAAYGDIIVNEVPPYGVIWGNCFNIGDGYILTCAHVIMDGTLTGRKLELAKWKHFDLELIDTNNILDVALLWRKGSGAATYEIESDAPYPIGTEVEVRFNMVNRAMDYTGEGNLLSDIKILNGQPYRSVSICAFPGMSGSPVCLRGTNKVVGILSGYMTISGEGLMVPMSLVIEWLGGGN